MTLKEKEFEQLSEAFANEIEKIADEFAIEFAEWITRAELPLKELLEIYKKENEL